MQVHSSCNPPSLATLGAESMRQSSGTRLYRRTRPRPRRLKAPKRFQGGATTRRGTRRGGDGQGEKTTTMTTEALDKSVWAGGVWGGGAHPAWTYAGPWSCGTVWGGGVWGGGAHPAWTYIGPCKPAVLWAWTYIGRENTWLEGLGVFCGPGRTLDRENTGFCGSGRYVEF